MTTKAMLDTSVLVGGIPAEIVEEIEDYCSSTICRGELVQGLVAFKADPPRQHLIAPRQELIRLLDAIPNFWRDFDRRAADGYGALAAHPVSALRLKDALIAGHAVSLEIALVTSDRGFGRFRDLNLIHTSS